MSATAQKRKTAPAQRVEILGRELARRREKLEAAEAEIQELESGQQQVVAEALRLDPTRSAFQRGAAASERERKQAELERSAAHLRQEILALQGEHDAAGAELAAQELAEATKNAKRLAGRELELRQAFGAAFAELVDRSNELMAALAARSMLAAEVKRADLLARVGFFNRDAVTAWEAAIVPAVEPVPNSFVALIEEALAASTSPRSDEDSEALGDLNRHRATLGLVQEQRSISPSKRALEECYPDLRSMIRTADGGAPIAGLAEAGFGLSGEVVYADDGQALPPAAA